MSVSRARGRVIGVWPQGAMGLLAPRVSYRRQPLRNASTARTRRWSASEGGRPSLPKMFETCFSTAPSVTTRRSADAGVVRPPALKASTPRPPRGGSSSTPFSVPPPLGQGAEPLALGRRELVEHAVLGAAAEELGDRLGVHRGPALGHAADGVDELLHVGDAVLEQVADAAAAVRQQLGRERALDVLR